MSRLLLVLAPLSVACSRAPDALPPAPPAQPKTAGAIEAQRVDEGVHPVYGAPEERSPVALRVCDAIYGIAERARAKCCYGSPSEGVVAGCVDPLSVALEDGAVSVDEDALGACERAAEQAFTGCDWAGAAVAVDGHDGLE